MKGEITVQMFKEMDRAFAFGDVNALAEINKELDRRYDQAVDMLEETKRLASSMERLKFLAAEIIVAMEKATENVERLIELDDKYENIRKRLNALVEEKTKEEEKQKEKEETQEDEESYW